MIDEILFIDLASAMNYLIFLPTGDVHVALLLIRARKFYYATIVVRLSETIYCMALT